MMTDADRALLLDGRPLTDRERELLTILAEECAEVARECNDVIIKASKLLRFGTSNTNPVTKALNNIELSQEIGDLSYMIARVQQLSFFDWGSFFEGMARKQAKLDKFSLYEDKAGR